MHEMDGHRKIIDFILPKHDTKRTISKLKLVCKPKRLNAIFFYLQQHRNRKKNFSMLVESL